MRPIRLEIRAFGPFGGVQELDFRALGERSFFLIHGATGAGKTSILDAMCFALYGETSGGERDARQMRSDHADPAMPTEVTFDFALGAERYRVRRRPAQERAKQRGEGMTEDRPQATLWCRTGLVDDGPEGRVLASQWSEVNRKVEELLGFRCDQFRQVVVLPQGRFRELLVAKSDDRQEILEALFDTEIYRRIEDGLKDAALRIKADLRELESRRADLLQQAAVASRDELDARVATLEQGVALRGARLERIRRLAERAETRLREGEKVAATLQGFEEAATRLRECECAKGAFDAKRERLMWARKADQIRPAEALLSERDNEWRDAVLALGRAEAVLREVRTGQTGADTALEREKAKEPERAQARDELQRLREMVPAVEELASAAAALDDACKKRGAAETRLETERLGIETVRTGLSEIRSKADEAAVAAARLEHLEREAQHRRWLFKQRRELEKKRSTLRGVQREHASAYRLLDEARQRYATAQHELQELEAQWIDGQAAILARQLEPSRPCPVCGSTEHPAPAHWEGPLPDQASLDLKRQDLVRIEAEREGARDSEEEKRHEQARLEASETSLIEALGGAADAVIATIVREVREARRALREARQAAARGNELATRVRDLEESVQKAEEQLRRTEQDVTGAQTSEKVAQATLEERARRIPPALQDRGALAGALAKATQRVQALDASFEKAQREAREAGEKVSRQQAAWEAAVSAEQGAREKARQQRVVFERQLDDLGFENVEDYRSAKEDVGRIEALENEVREFETNLEAARLEAERRKAAVAGLVQPDLEGLQAAAARAKALFERAVRRESELQGKVTQTRAYSEKLSRLEVQKADLEERFAVYGRIAEVANGRNEYRMTFRRFVLVTILDEVLFEAGRRLKHMSRGRFELQRARDPQGGRSPGGLDLQVFDAYTGTARPVATLSGGEGFLASLSLALGLAEVVQARAGGRHLETVFVDEGFGSLDSEVLDLAVQTLVDLQGGGRLVGIISHIGELKERIDTRLEVTAHTRGSQARFVVGG
ncbi:MAG: SMC family ATPase [Planctomycetota bacterium]